MTELLIQGDWEPADGPASHPLIDPTTRKLLEPVQSASPAQRQRAVEAARAAHDSWSQRTPEDRVAIVLGIVDEIRQAAGGLAERQAIESGQPLRECQDLVVNALRRLRAATPPDEPTDVQVRRLAPQSLWDFWERALNAIAAGSTIVSELPADRALTALAVARYAHKLPPGVLNTITVDADTESPTDAATGTERRESREAPAVRRGASDFVYVGPDTYLDVAVAGSAALRLYNTGQRTGQSARIHVDASIAYKFADRLHEYLAFLEAGDPRKPVTDLGPLQSERVMHRAIEQIGAVLKQGALVKLGGRPYQPWGLRGHFLQPTLLIEGAGPERAPLESIAGPVVIISPTTDIGAALRESVGDSHAALRLCAFTQQRQKVERSLQAASLGPHTTVEWIEAPRSDWFPYKNRRGIKL
jgi:acyl-CoA reductase-like NAD-dependent aldehyde dehydrogenase